MKWGAKYGSTAKRFWRYVYKTANCWFWLGTLNPDGYGKFQNDLRREAAHRVAWRLTKGPIPKGKEVMHKCDIPQCVNPGHLELGTHRQNGMDAGRKGRLGPRAFWGLE